MWAVAFACVISFMGIGLVDPILPALSTQLHATPSQVTLLFTSYLVVTAVAMLVTGWVSSRIGAKNTLIAGLVLIVSFAALAGLSDSIGGIVGFRAGWGLGNALFIATSLAVIVGSASGGFAGAIVLYESALGVGIACGPLLGALLGNISWRGPFFGVSALMAIALVATVAVRPADPTPGPQGRAVRAAARAPAPRPADHGHHRPAVQLGLLHDARLRALPHGPVDLPARRGVLRVGPAGGRLLGVRGPVLQRRFGTAPTLYVNLFLFAAVLAVIAVFTDSPATLVVMVVAAGALIGVNNTLMTQAVMLVAPVERSVASAAYGFIRFIGGGLAPFAAGLLAEHYNVHVPFFIGSATVLLSIAVLASGHRMLASADERLAAGA